MFFFTFFIENNLISPNKFDFEPGDSCTSQLTSIPHEIYQTFDDGFQFRGAPVDISKAFDKVWHNGLIYKLKQNRVAGNLIDTWTNFFNERKEGAIFCDHHSTWMNDEAWVPEGSVISPLIALVYINDLLENLGSNSKLFADYISLFSVIRTKQSSAQKLNEDLNKVNHWVFNGK